MSRTSHRQSNLLTKKQRQVLDGLLEGKTIKDLADEMDRSKAAVEDHARRAAKTLHQPTVARAVRAWGQHPYRENTALWELVDFLVYSFLRRKQP